MTAYEEAMLADLDTHEAGGLAPARRDPGCSQRAAPRCCGLGPRLDAHLAAGCPAFLAHACHAGAMTSPMPLCAHCGRPSERVFPRDKAGDVCSSCYEVIARRRPEWSRLEVLGVIGLVVGSALLMVAVVALLVR
ncbi:MAG: hypothetical protein NVSMB55_08740 [Mycobacteriales bacterium]